MDRPVTFPLLRVGAWCVDPTAGQISRDGQTIRVDARVMRLLQYLAERSGQVVSVDELLDKVWSGVVVTPDSVYQAVASLRRTLGDDPRQPTYIANVPRLGYRMVATVGPWIDRDYGRSGAGFSRRAAARHRPKGRSPSISTQTHIARGHGTRPRASCRIGVFHRQGCGRHEGRSSCRRGHIGKVGCRAGVPRPDRGDGPGIFRRCHDRGPDRPAQQDSWAARVTAQILVLFKDKRATVGEIAAALKVAYVLDGSLRESGSTLRVTARLIRADGGFIVWSQSYERPLDDLPMIRDDIVSHVVEACSRRDHDRPAAVPGNIFSSLDTQRLQHFPGVLVLRIQQQGFFTHLARKSEGRLLDTRPQARRCEIEERAQLAAGAPLANVDEVDRQRLRFEFSQHHFELSRFHGVRRPDTTTRRARPTPHAAASTAASAVLTTIRARTRTESPERNTHGAAEPRPVNMTQSCVGKAGGLFGVPRAAR